MSLLYHCSGVFAQLFLLLLEGVYLNAVPVPNKPPPDDPPPPLDGAIAVGAATAGATAGAASLSQFLKFKFMVIYMSMNIEFKKWLIKLEMAGTGAIVSCKDRNNPNFQVWGAMSDLGCNKKKKSKKK
jgi:hypothetical protein